MANRIDSHFNDFGGIDSRTNKMVQNPKTARDGRNFEYRIETNKGDFDVIAKRRGFQRKAQAQYGAEYGLIKYEFKDIDTGERKEEILGVGADGKLRKRRADLLRFAVGPSTVARYYSFYYDEINLNYRFEILNASKAVIASHTFTTSTLSALATALNATVSIHGINFIVVNDSDTSIPITSSLSATLLDFAFEKEIAVDPIVNNYFFSPVYYWELVPTPKPNQVLFPYIGTLHQKRNPEFEGATYVNLNNSVYMTAGEFPIKYDGKAAYRAGMPHTIGTYGTGGAAATSFDGFDLSATTGGSLTASSTYRYKFQFGFVDANGVEILGKINRELRITLSGSQNAVTISIPPIKRDDRFPVFACKVNGNQDLSNSSKTFNVFAGHNIRPGMLLRIPVSQNILGFAGFSHHYVLVESVTATSITIANTFFTTPPDHPFGGATTTLVNNQWIQAGYGPASLNNKITEPVTRAASRLLPEVLVGAFVRVYRTRANQDGPYYRLIDLPLQYDDGTSPPGDKYNFQDIYSDTSTDARLSTEILDESEGEELPRACRYLSKWQGQLVQAGRPYNPYSLKFEPYPSNYAGLPTIGGWTHGVLPSPLLEVTEALLADSQSIYWSDPLNPEGFPQSGLFEESFNSEFLDQVTGMGESKGAFYVFKERSMFVLNGNLATQDIRSERYETDIGCAAFNSIVQIQGGLFWLDKTYGFCAVIANQMPRIIGYPVQNYQKENEFKERLKFLRFSGAKAVNDFFGNKYICYVPAGTTALTNADLTPYIDVPYPTADSLTFVYDYSANRNCWYIWSGFNAAGGFVYSNDAIFAHSWESASENYLIKQKYTGSKYDFSDHTSPINFEFKSAWINFGSQNIDKKWIQVAISSIKRGFSLLVSQYYNYNESAEGEISVSFNAANTASPKITIALNKLKALAFSLGLKNNNLNEDVSINGWDVQFSAEYDRGEVKS